MRTPKYEFIFDEVERGVKMSDEAWLENEDDMLEEIEFRDNSVRIGTSHHQIELDLKTTITSVKIQLNNLASSNIEIGLILRYTKKIIFFNKISDGGLL